MKRVKWDAKHEYEYIDNLKLLQQAFLKVKIKKWLDVCLFLNRSFILIFC